MGIPESFHRLAGWSGIGRFGRLAQKVVYAEKPGTGLPWIQRLGVAACYLAEQIGAARPGCKGPGSNIAGGTINGGRRTQEMVSGNQFVVDHAEEAALIAVFALHKLNHDCYRIMVKLLPTIQAHRPLDSKPSLPLL